MQILGFKTEKRTKESRNTEIQDTLQKHGFGSYCNWFNMVQHREYACFTLVSVENSTHIVS